MGKSHYHPLIRDLDGEASPVPYKAPPKFPRRCFPASWPQGWRFGILAGALSASSSFLVNLFAILFIIAAYSAQSDGDGRFLLFQGDCDTVGTYNTMAHVYINIMSTILLASSNYAMQCLSAVTRKDVDAAHNNEQGPRWAEIGVPSFVNLWHVGWKKTMLWGVLGISSLPLHVFYNAAVFSSVATYAYPIASTNAEYANSLWNGTDFSVTDYSSFANYTNGSSYEGAEQFRNLTLYNESSLEDCMSAFATDFQTSIGGLLLVLDVPEVAGSNFTDPIIFSLDLSWTNGASCVGDEYAWMCAQTGKNICSSILGGAETCAQQLPALKTNITGWRPFVAEYPVRSCFVVQEEGRCKLQASLQVIIVVLVLNFLKAMAMFSMLKVLKEAPLLTMGDAVASFLESPDLQTKGLCLVSRHQITRRWGNRPRLVFGPRKYTGRRRRWFSGAGKFRQILFVTVFICTLSALGILFIEALGYLSTTKWVFTMPTLKSLGFGTPNAAAIINWAATLPRSGTSGLFWNAFIANSPQLILSLLYFSYNAILTAYFLGSEWQSYAFKRKGLRVSAEPVGAQRSTYFLSLPYRAAIPLLVTAGVLHWLVSQSIFLVNIERYVWDGTLANPANHVGIEGNGARYRAATFQDNIGGSDRNPNILSCGFSPLPISIVLAVGGLMLIVLAFVGLLRFRSSMPVTAGNSLVIAAACHLQILESEEGDAGTENLQWGAVGLVESDGVGHCSFSSWDVEKPEVGEWYA